MSKVTGRWKPGDTVTIQFGPVKCKFLTPYPKQLDNELCIDYPGKFFSPSYKNGNWDGKHWFITSANYFPTGLLPLVYAILKTGKNPISSNPDTVVLMKRPKEVKLKIPKGGWEYFNPNFVKYYLQDMDVLNSLDEEQGIIHLPKESLRNLKKCKDANRHAKKVFSLLNELSL